MTPVPPLTLRTIAHMRLMSFVTTLTERALAPRVLRDMGPSHVDELLPYPFPEDIHRLPTFSFVEKMSLRDDMEAFASLISYLFTTRFIYPRLLYGQRTCLSSRIVSEVREKPSRQGGAAVPPSP